MKDRKFGTMVLAGFGMLVLILDGKTALLGMRDGLEICLWTVIPALFPFLFLSAILTDSLYGRKIPAVGRLARWCRIPEDAGCLLVIGFLGGYPAGAANAARLYRNGSLDGDTAQRLAIICNNAGPAFLFGILGNLFSQMQFPLLLWTVHIASSLVVARFLPGEPVKEWELSAVIHRPLLTLFNGTIKTMASICGWVVLFRLILTFLERWFLWMLPDILAILLTGCLELSNGCLALSRIPSEEIRFYIAAFLLGFGGLCVTMQTFSVCEGLQLRGYVGTKLLHGIVSSFLAFAVYRGKTATVLPAVLFLTPLFLSFPRKSEKRGSNSTAGVV